MTAEELDRMFLGRAIHPSRAYNPAPGYLKLSAEITKVTTEKKKRPSKHTNVTAYMEDGTVHVYQSIREAMNDLELSWGRVSAVMNDGRFSHKMQSPRGIIVGMSSETIKRKAA